MRRKPRAVRRARKRIGRELTPKRVGWMLVASGAAMLAGKVVDSALAGGWRALTDEDPPDDPRDPDVPWTRALVWAAAAGAAVAVARLVAERGAAEGWTRATGKRPPQAPTLRSTGTMRG